jgi:glycosyltransferase involved in cell wall biosynthesis
MNILLVTPEFAPKIGGMARSADRLGTNFAFAGHATTIVTYDRTDDVLKVPYTHAECAEIPGLSVLRVGPIASRHTGVPNDMKAFLKRQFFEEALRALGDYSPPDVVLSLGLVDAGFLGLCMANALGCPHVVSARGADVGTELFKGDRFALGAAVTFVNRYLLDVASSVFGRSSKFQIIRNGVPELGAATEDERTVQGAVVRRSLEIPADAHVVGWTGTFRHKKGLKYLSEAFRALARERPNIYLLVVGGPRREKERSQCTVIDSEDLGHRTRCVGIIEKSADVYPYYSAMDVFAYPSLDDGLSNAVLEAMALGVPVVASDIFHDVATDRETALLVPRFDAGALARAITAILDEPELGQRISAQARALVLDAFSVSREIEAYLSLFHQIVTDAAGQCRR